jgi:hypothetical protein
MSHYTRVQITLEGGLLSEKEVVSIARSSTLQDTEELVDFLELATQSVVDGYIAVTGLPHPDDGDDGFEGIES